MAGLFQVLWGRADGTFKKPTVLNGSDGEPLIIPSTGEKNVVESICTRPTAVDWDADGDLDLVVGNFAGKFYLFTGEGKGRFQPKPQPVMAADQPLQLKGNHGDPFMVDWDGDRDLDMLSGSSLGGVQWAENTAGPGKPITVKPFATLIEPPKDARGNVQPEAVSEPSGSTRVFVADLNADGKLDILLGDDFTLVSPAEGVSDADFNRRLAEWNQENQALEAEMQGVTDEAQYQPFMERMRALGEKRSAFVVEEWTGFVWAYLQK